MLPAASPSIAGLRPNVNPQPRRIDEFPSRAALYGCHYPQLRSNPMSAAARSILVYSIYLFGLGAALLVVPNIPIRLFGLAEATEVWVRILGMTVVFFSIYYFIAARNEFRPFFVASCDSQTRC